MSNSAEESCKDVVRLHPVRWLLLFLIAFFFIYAIAFKSLPEQLHTARIIALMAFAIFGLKIIRQQGKIAVQSDLLFVLALYLCYFGWIAARTVLVGVDDISLLTNVSLLFLQVIPGAMLVVACVRYSDLRFHQLILLLQMVIVFQAALIILTFVSWDFRMLTLSLLHETGSNIEPLHPYRVRGLTHNTGAKLSAFQAMAFFLTSYLLFRYERGPVFWYLCGSMPVLLASILLTGRVGFIGFGIAVVMSFWWMQMAPSSKGIVKGMLLIPVAGVVGYLALEALYLVSGEREMAWGEDAFQSMIRWVASEFALYIKSGTLATGTVGRLLQNHWFWPASDAAFLLGDPQTWSLQRIKSDVGMVRMVFGAGLIGTTLLYSAAAAVCFVTRRYLDSMLDRSLIMALFVWIAVFELKEASFLDLRSGSLMMVILIYAIWSQDRLAATRVK